MNPLEIVLFPESREILLYVLSRMRQRLHDNGENVAEYVLLAIIIPRENLTVEVFYQNIEVISASRFQTLHYLRRADILFSVQSPPYECSSYSIS